MGCGSAKISLTHGRRAGGRRRGVDHTDGTESDGHGGEEDEEEESHYTRSIPAAIVASTSVDSDIVRSSRRPKITTSFSQNDFSTTTSVSATSRIRVTLSHDGSLLEVETETLGTPEEETNNIEILSPARSSHMSRHHGRREDAFPSCSGTQSHSRSTTKNICSASSSGSSSHFGQDELDLSLRGRFGSVDEDDDIYTAEVTAFMTVADIEEEPRRRANRSKSINSILSQAEESHLLELESKRKHLCKECGCPKASKRECKQGKKVTQNSHRKGLEAKTKNETPKYNSKIKQMNSSSSEEGHASHRTTHGMSTPTSTHVRTATPYSHIDENPGRKEPSAPLPDGASPLSIEKHPECCCYCHHRGPSGKTGGKWRCKADRVPGTPVRTNPSTRSSTAARTVFHYSEDGTLPNDCHPTGGGIPQIPEKPSSCRPFSDSFACYDPKERTQRHPKGELGDTCSLGPIQAKANWTNCEASGNRTNSTMDPMTYPASSAHVNGTGCPNDCDVVIVPVAPIVDPNVIFNFDDDWGDVLLRNGRAIVDSNQSETPPVPPRRGVDAAANRRQHNNRNHGGVCQSGTNSESSGHETMSKEGLSMDLPGSDPGDGAIKLPPDVRSTGSSGCAQGVDDRCDVTDSSKTTVTSSSSTGDVTAVLSGGVADGWVLYDSLDPAAVCVQVHADFFNDFCDFFDDEDDCVH